jgi:hypothetical protein
VQTPYKPGGKIPGLRKSEARLRGLEREPDNIVWLCLESAQADFACLKRADLPARKLGLCLA